MTDELSMDDLEATLAVRKEHGPEIDAALVESLAAKVDAVVERRVQAELAERHHPQQVKAGQLALAITSLALSIPLTAITASLAGLLGVFIVWIGIAIVNIAYGFNGPSKGGRR